MANYKAIQTGILIREFLRGGTCKQIADRAGYNHSTVMRYAKVWHGMGVVYIDRWTMDASLRPVRVFKLQVDNLKDAEKPAPFTNSQCCKRYKMKKAGATKRIALTMLKQREAA